MTERLAHRDLRNRSAEVLRDVAAGATYEITNHGDVVAILAPPGGSVLRIRKAIRHGGFAQIRRVTSQETSQEIIEDLRGDR